MDMLIRPHVLFITQILISIDFLPLFPIFPISPFSKYIVSLFTSMKL